MSNVVVHTSTGERYRLFFYDPVRMRQELEIQARSGKPYLAEPNFVLLPEVTTETVRNAVHGLWQDGYFEHVKPL